MYICRTLKEQSLKDTNSIKVYMEKYKMCETKMIHFIKLCPTIKNQSTEKLEKFLVEQWDKDKCISLDFVDTKVKFFEKYLSVEFKIDNEIYKITVWLDAKELIMQ